MLSGRLTSVRSGADLVELRLPVTAFLSACDDSPDLVAEAESRFDLAEHDPVGDLRGLMVLMGQVSAGLPDPRMGPKISRRF